MFSGIVETKARVLRAFTGDGILHIVVARPPTFDDLHCGDSIAVDGVCLTVEEFDQASMGFSLGPETLKITGWDAQRVIKDVNLERSLRLNDRVHGHLVTGHVDAVAEIVKLERQGETLSVLARVPQSLTPFIWSKGSVTLNGVSLTVNRVEGQHVAVWLIPETLKRTNLGEAEVGTVWNIEVDNLARGLVHIERLNRENS